MKFNTLTSPHTFGPTGLNIVMRDVILALLPALIIHWWVFGWGIISNILAASVLALSCEAAILKIRKRPIKPSLTDLSALVTAWLFAFAIPPGSPWWMITIGIAFAIIIAKHLYGGLGSNPFNPAMVAYVVLLISYPFEMTQWLAPASDAQTPMGLLDTLHVAITGSLPQHLQWDGVTMATPLDFVKTQLSQNMTVSELAAAPQLGLLGGAHWEVLNFALLLGGIWLIYRRVITWHIPAAMLGSIAALALIFYIVDSDSYASPLFHLFSGGTMLGAFFIATDPVTATSSREGRLIYGACIGALVFVIRSWGGFPDGIAFAVLLMNMAAPTIDHFYKPSIYGQSSK